MKTTNVRVYVYTSGTSDVVVRGFDEKNAIVEQAYSHHPKSEKEAVITRLKLTYGADNVRVF